MEGKSNAEAVTTNGTADSAARNQPLEYEQEFKMEPEVIIMHEEPENMLQDEEDYNENIEKKNDLALENSIESSSVNFSCECGRSFKSEEQIRSHLCIYPSKLMFTYKEEERTFVCLDCGKAFLRRNHLQRHEQTHSGIRPHICTECGTGFFRSEHLSRHMKTHIGQKLYECHMCTKRLTRPEHLVRHLKIHDRDGRQICLQCGLAFDSSRELYNHLRDTHISPEEMEHLSHGERIYKTELL